MVRGEVVAMAVAVALAVAVAVGGGGGGGRVVGVAMLRGLVCPCGQRPPPPRALFVRAPGPPGRVQLVRSGRLSEPRSRARQHDVAFGPFDGCFFELVDAHDLWRRRVHGNELRGGGTSVGGGWRRGGRGGTLERRRGALMESDRA